MINSVGSTAPRTYNMQQLYSEAMKMLKAEVQGYKKAPLTPEENQKIERLAKAVSNEVVKEMRV